MAVWQRFSGDYRKVMYIFYVKYYTYIFYYIYIWRWIFSFYLPEKLHIDWGEAKVNIWFWVEIYSFKTNFHHLHSKFNYKKIRECKSLFNSWKQNNEWLFIYIIIFPEGTYLLLTICQTWVCISLLTSVFYILCPLTIHIVCPYKVHSLMAWPHVCTWAKRTGA